MSCVKQYYDLPDIPRIVGTTEMCVTLVNEEKEETPMKKHFVSNFNLSKKFDTREEAETYTKKQMEQYSKAYGQNSDGYVYGAVACVRFPTPSYEVVDLDDVKAEA